MRASRKIGRMTFLRVAAIQVGQISRQVKKNIGMKRVGADGRGLDASSVCLRVFDRQNRPAAKRPSAFARPLNRDGGHAASPGMLHTVDGNPAVLLPHEKRFGNGFPPPCPPCLLARQHAAPKELAVGKRRQRRVRQGLA